MAAIAAETRIKELVQGVTTLRPNYTPLLWHTFAEIATIPRKSRAEKPMADYLELIGKNNELTVERDEHNNIFIIIPATPGYDAAPKTILQCHSDMVCAKDEDADHDPAKDGVHVIVEQDGTIRADKTTLGADNGIGISMALAAISDPELKHGEMGILVTMNEEDGLEGASKLAFKSMKRFNNLVNLDWEVEGQAIIGSAGGIFSNISLPLEKEDIGNKTLISLDVAGLSGGHSGLKIDQGGANGIQTLARVIADAAKEFNINIVSIMGGDEANIIPKNAQSIIALNPERLQEFNEFLLREKMKVAAELHREEEQVNFSLVSGKSESKSGLMLNDTSTDKVLQLIRKLPHGVLHRRDKDVITSTNLANVRTNDTSLDVVMMSRSAFPDRLKVQTGFIEYDAQEKFFPGITVSHHDEFPGWVANENRAIIESAKRIYKQVTDADLEVRVTHAGLECGLIGLNNPNLLDGAISIGPTIKNAHETSESTDIDSVERTYSFLKAFIADLSRLPQE